MSNIRLFYPESLSINLEGTLNKTQSHYLTKVMRINTGEVFSLFNKSGEWEAIINEISKNNLTFKVQKQLRQKENESEIWLAFSPIKSNYFNFMIQKATELGVTKLIPVLTERTIVRKINIERLSKIVIEASEQSNRLSIPEILETQSLENFLKNNSSINLIFGDLNTDNKKIVEIKRYSECIYFDTPSYEAQKTYIRKICKNENNPDNISSKELIKKGFHLHFPDIKSNKNMALEMPILHRVEKGFFYKWMKSQNKLGRQFKVPRLANHRNHIDSIFNLMETMKSE